MTYVLLTYRATKIGKKPSGLDERATLRGHGKLQSKAAAPASNRTARGGSAQTKKKLGASTT